MNHRITTNGECFRIEAATSSFLTPYIIEWKHVSGPNEKKYYENIEEAKRDMEKLEKISKRLKDKWEPVK